MFLFCVWNTYNIYKKNTVTLTSLTILITESENLPSTFEGLVIELSLNFKIWLLICLYNPHRKSIKDHIRDTFKWGKPTLREKCSNAELFLVRIFIWYFPVFGPEITPYLDVFHAVQNVHKYEKIIFMGDYNAEVPNIQKFCESYFLENIVENPTCFKSPAKPTCVHLMVINTLGMFRNAKVYERGLSDFHELVVSIMKLSYKKRPPHMIKHRDYKKLSN